MLSPPALESDDHPNQLDLVIEKPGENLNNLIPGNVTPNESATNEGALPAGKRARPDRSASRRRVSTATSNSNGSEKPESEYQAHILLPIGS